MPRIILFAAVLTVAGLAAAPAARAGIMLSLDDVSSHSIQSGESFTFAIRLSGAGVASYDIVTLIGGSTGTAGTDFNAPAPTDPPSAGYVFSTTTGNFSAGLQTVGSPPSLALALSDYSDTEVTGAAGDLIAKITVTTAATFVGKITVDFDPAGLTLLDGNFDDITDFGVGAGFTVNVGSGGGGVIPEPASAVMLGLGGLGLAGLGLARRSNQGPDARGR